VSRLPLLKKNDRCRAGFLLAAALISFSLFGRAAADGENAWLDENQVRQAMRQEAFRLLAEKIDAVRNGAAEGFDYHIEQAYEKIKNRLPSDLLSASELEAWLQQYLQNQKAADSEAEFQSLIENFIRGMSLEIITTLQFECEQAEDLIAQVDKLDREIRKAPHPDRDALEQAMRQSGLSKKISAVIKNSDHGWRIPPADADSFNVFSILKKNMSGQSADRDQRLIFDLGERYRAQYPFLSGFMEYYRRLAETFRRAVLDLDATIEDGGEPVK
jgi:hypothetical protein